MNLMTSILKRYMNINSKLFIGKKVEGQDQKLGLVEYTCFVGWILKLCRYFTSS